MLFDEEKLRKIYDDAKKGKNDFNAINSIAKALYVICPRMEYDSYVLNDIIKTLLIIENNGKINFINENTMKMVCRLILGSDEEVFDDFSNLYLDLYLRYIFVPYNNCKVRNPYNIGIFIDQFEEVVSFIYENYDIENLSLLKKINPEFAEVVSSFIYYFDQYHNSKLYQLAPLCDRMAIFNTFLHLATIFYFNLDNYDKDYKILHNVYEKINNNYFEFLEFCMEEGTMPDFSERDLYILQKELIVCEKFLHQEYQPPIRINKKK